VLHLTLQFQNGKRVDVDHHRLSVAGTGGLGFVDVFVAVEQVAGAEALHQPAEDGKPPVRRVYVIVDAQGRGVGHQNVQIPPVPQPVQQQGGEQAGDLPAHFGLSVLKRSVGPVTERAFQPRQQERTHPRGAAVQVDPAARLFQPHPLTQVLRHVVVAVDVEGGDVQHGDHVFQVGIGQVAAGEEQVHIPEPLPNVGAVDGLHDLVAEGQNFHSSYLTQRHKDTKTQRFPELLGQSLAGEKFAFIRARPRPLYKKPASGSGGWLVHPLGWGRPSAPDQTVRSGSQGPAGWAGERYSSGFLRK